jgi:DNA polymerase
MDSRRRSYLRALDIDVWERRSLTEPASAPAEGVVLAATDETGARFAAESMESWPEEPVALQPPPAGATPRPAVTQVAGDPAVAALGWPELETAVKSCTRCPLHQSRTQGVFGVGNRTARWMIVGEAPGADEDRQGEPFVGRAGQLLNSMLKAIGLKREEVFIANILKSRPPNNRDPKPEEVQACIPYLFRQIELVDPTLILCVGRIAAQTLLDTSVTIGKLRGQVHRLASGRPMIVTYHPAYLLRSPVEKRKSWADLVLAMQTFDRLSHA